MTDNVIDFAPTTDEAPRLEEGRPTYTEIEQALEQTQKQYQMAQLLNAQLAMALLNGRMEYLSVIDAEDVNVAVDTSTPNSMGKILVHVKREEKPGTPAEVAAAMHAQGISR